MDWRNSIASLTLVAATVCSSRCVVAQESTQGTIPPATSLRISLDEAIRRAEAKDPSFAAANAESRALQLERTNARAALLPTATYHNQVIYTEPNGQTGRIGQTVGEPTPVFIANNAIREYASQGIFNETAGFQQIGAVRLADATAARAEAEAEIARRGLVATVVGLYYGYGSQSAKTLVASRALDEANHFVEITQQREQAREAAHADVIKAQIEQQQRTRDSAEAQLAQDKARLELAVLLFADPMTPFDVEPPAAPVPLPERSVIEASARQNNPELKSALASLKASEAESYSARAAFFPEVGLNATYGIDAPQFAVNGPEGVRNLGYSGSVSLDIPVWDWLTSERKLKESKIRKEASEVALSAAQRRLLADLNEFYAEARISESQLTSLNDTVISARESLRLTNLRYINGESSALEVVDAQNTLTFAELAQADGTVRYQLALAQLQTLTGRL
jgi:outer membrane protein TolC